MSQIHFKVDFNVELGVHQNMRRPRLWLCPTKSGATSTPTLFAAPLTCGVTRRLPSSSPVGGLGGFRHGPHRRTRPLHLVRTRGLPAAPPPEKIKIDFGPQLGETFLSARHDFKIDFMQSCKFDFKIDFLQHWANHLTKGSRSMIRVESDPPIWETGNRVTF